MEIYNGNSFKQKNEEKKKLNKVVTGNVKKTTRFKLSELLLSDDSKNVKEYLITDVIIPTVKDLLSDIVSKGINLILFGEGSVNRKRSSQYGSTSYVSYNSAYTASKPSRSSSHAYSDDIILESRAEAEEVLTALCDAIDEYNVVSVCDLYDLVGLPTESTDNKFGWTNLSSASVERVKEGYLLKLPKAKPID